jgi:hypothetical protein
MKKLNQKFRKKFISRLRKAKADGNFEVYHAILSAAGIPTAMIEGIPDGDRSTAMLTNFIKVIKVDRHRAGIRTLTNGKFAPKGCTSIYEKLNKLSDTGKSPNYIAGYVERYL